MSDRLKELLRYSDLLRNLVLRDLKVRYKSSFLGFLWSLINPLLLMLVLTVVFTIMLPNYRIPKFPVFVLCALLPWNFFSTSIMSCTTSIVQNGHLINKVYFPREILPISSVFSNLVNFLLALPVLAIFIALFRIPITVWILYLPLIMVVQVAFTVGVGLILATANVFYRDTAVIMEVIVQAWFFLTPVFYPAALLPTQVELWGLTVPVRRLVYILNPVASMIASYRSVLYGFTDGSPPAAPAPDFFLRTALTAFVCLAFGYWIFCRHSGRFGEEV